MVRDEVWHHNAVWYGSLWLVGLQGMVLLLIWTLGMVWHDFLYLAGLQRMTFAPMWILEDLPMGISCQKMYLLRYCKRKELYKPRGGPMSSI